MQKTFKAKDHWWNTGEPEKWCQQFGPGLFGEYQNKTFFSAKELIDNLPLAADITLTVRKYKIWNQYNITIIAKAKPAAN